MSKRQSETRSPESEWPMFALRHTYNPEDLAPGKSFEPNELVVYDAKDRQDDRWISAKHGSYMPVTEIR